MRKSIYKKLQNRIRLMLKNYRSDRVFSRKLARCRLVGDTASRLHLRGIAAKANAKKDEVILSYLSETSRPVLDQYVGADCTGEYQECAPVWVCWWSGTENAPELVRQCVQSIRKHSGIHPVHLITEKTCRNYLEIPAYILDKVQNGSMGLANFSDYLRFSLLEKYGGLWLDATVFLSAGVPEEVFHMPVFTCKSEYDPETAYISKMQWTSFIFGGYRGNILFRCMRELFENYWEREEAAIDYLLLDYILALVKKQIPAARRYLQAAPVNNVRRDDLQAAMNAALPAEDFYNIVQPDTIFYKLSWRETYAEKTADGKKSVYRYFLDMDMGELPV